MNDYKGFGASLTLSRTTLEDAEVYVYRDGARSLHLGDLSIYAASGDDQPPLADALRQLADLVDNATDRTSLTAVKAS